VAVRSIRVFGDPVLRQVADPVGDVDDGVRALVRDLLDTVDAPGHAGLAAPQIGVPLRAFSYNVDGRLGYVLNPVLVATSEEQQADDEGCLSVPGLWFPTRRARWARVEGTDVDGAPVAVEGEGLMARCLQHEVDHLDGLLYLSRLEPEVRRRAMREVRERVVEGAW
jgi:peptide deformylase